jgi:hypothetical protein
VTARLAAILLLLSAVQAWGFDYARYQASDLDELIAQKRPQTGMDIHPGRPHRFTATLVRYGEPCETGLLKRAMIVGGSPKSMVDATAITRCIMVRSVKNTDVRLFIQDQVASHLPVEVPLDRAVTLYAVQVFNGRDGPGLLVNEFSAQNAGESGK